MNYCDHHCKWSTNSAFWICNENNSGDFQVIPTLQVPGKLKLTLGFLVMNRRNRLAGAAGQIPELRGRERGRQLRGRERGSWEGEREAAEREAAERANTPTLIAYLIHSLLLLSQIISIMCLFSIKEILKLHSLWRTRRHFPHNISWSDMAWLASWAWLETICNGMFAYTLHFHIHTMKDNCPI